jgi:uncharacterized coiled-coil protein SlyX
LSQKIIVLEKIVQEQADKISQLEEKLNQVVKHLNLVEPNTAPDQKQSSSTVFFKS